MSICAEPRQEWWTDGWAYLKDNTELRVFVTKLTSGEYLAECDQEPLLLWATGKNGVAAAEYLRRKAKEYHNMEHVRRGF